MYLRQKVVMRIKRVKLCKLPEAEPGTRSLLYKDQLLLSVYFDISLGGKLRFYTLLSLKMLLRSPGVENGNLLQYSCLGNSMDRGAQWATVNGVSKGSDTT